MYKLLVTDMDGTLLNSKHQISQPNIQAIERLQQAGSHFVLASGRPNGGMYRYAEQLQCATYDGYMISFNGGRIERLATGEVLYEKGIQPIDFARLVQFAEAMELVISGYDGSKIIVNRLSAEAQVEADLTGLILEVVPDITAYFAEKVTPKAIFFGDEAAVAAAKPKLLNYVDGTLEVAISLPIFLEVMPKGVHKGEAVKILANHLGMSEAHVVAVGDGENDIQMLELAGIGVAVANARSSVIKVANDVTHHHDDHAMEQVIMKYWGL